LGFIALAPAVAMASMLPLGIPENGHLNFTVTRDGDAIGTHVFKFRKQGRQTDVEIQTKIDYRLLSIPVYRFRHESKETWVGDRLTSLISVTDDNGDSVQLKVAPLAKGSGLLVQKQDGHLKVERGIVPASLWNASLIGKNHLLGTVGGDLLTTKATFVGDETISVLGKKIAVRHYRLSGGLNRDLWYDRATNVLVQVQFKAEDGSKVEFLRQH
jgi:hypothetical protein